MLVLNPQPFVVSYICLTVPVTVQQSCVDFFVHRTHTLTALATMLRMFDNAAGSFDVDKKRNIKNPLAVPYWLQPLATGCLNCGYQRKPSAQAVYMYTSVHITYRCVWCAGINAIRAVRRASEWNKSVLIHCKTFAVSILLSSADIHAYERGIWCDVIGQYMTGNHSIRATSALACKNHIPVSTQQ